MQYAQQTQAALDRLDESLLGLRELVKRGKIQEALQYMENGPLKERFGELQNMVILSQTNNLGARGTAPQTGTL
tara:strand:- start:79 stop:300 length:222 start_codon:yes stop_codon:yes gene_type:complete